MKVPLSLSLSCACNPKSPNRLIGETASFTCYEPKNFDVLQNSTPNNSSEVYSLNAGGNPLKASSGKLEQQRIDSIHNQNSNEILVPWERDSLEHEISNMSIEEFLSDDVASQLGSGQPLKRHQAKEAFSIG